MHVSKEVFQSGFLFPSLSTETIPLSFLNEISFYMPYEEEEFELEKMQEYIEMKEITQPIFLDSIKEKIKAAIKKEIGKYKKNETKKILFKSIYYGLLLIYKNNINKKKLDKKILKRYICKHLSFFKTFSKEK